MYGQHPLVTIWAIWKLAKFGTVCNSLFQIMSRQLASHNPISKQELRKDMKNTGNSYNVVQISLYATFCLGHSTSLTNQDCRAGRYFRGAPLTINGDPGNTPGNCGSLVLSIKWPHKCVNENWRGLGSDPSSWYLSLKWVVWKHEFITRL